MEGETPRRKFEDAPDVNNVLLISKSTELLINSNLNA